MFTKSYTALSPLKRSIVSAIIGFFVYGTWAMAVNLMHGKESAIKAGVTQGLYSFTLTFIMTFLIETIYKAMMQVMPYKVIAATSTVVLCCVMVFSGSWYINFLAGTPEIFNTVILGYVLGGLYAIAYTIVLAKDANFD